VNKPQFLRAESDDNYDSNEGEKFEIAYNVRNLLPKNAVCCLPTDK
jgi:hypothetical protein